MRSKKSKAPEIDASVLENRNLKERITTLIDYDALKWLRETSQSKGLPYQTFLNMIVREAMENAHNHASSSRQSSFDELLALLNEERRARPTVPEKKMHPVPKPTHRPSASKRK